MTHSEARMQKRYKNNVPAFGNLDGCRGAFVHWRALNMQKAHATNITSVLHETRVFKPSKEFSSQAHIKSLAEYKKLYRQSIRSPEKFWAKQAKNELVWF